MKNSTNNHNETTREGMVKVWNCISNKRLGAENKVRKAECTWIQQVGQMLLHMMQGVSRAQTCTMCTTIHPTG